MKEVQQVPQKRNEETAGLIQGSSRAVGLTARFRVGGVKIFAETFCDKF